MLFLTCLLLIASSDVSAQEHTDWQQATSTASHQEYSFPSESGKLKKKTQTKNKKNPPQNKTKKPVKQPPPKNPNNNNNKKNKNPTPRKLSKKNRKVYSLKNKKIFNFNKHWIVLPWYLNLILFHLTKIKKHLA